ncbi:MAG: radical SAM family heme chaperone HemW [Flavobacteriales bacterium]|nr:radical SAM family heme chaperone HemW [Flavobacteriales bacterium]
MAGLYIHIPFCRKACVYCDFHFSTTLKSQGDLVKSILKEIEIRSDFLGEPLESIYFGGGTPSLLSFDELEAILLQIKRNFQVSEHCEITLEANPDDLTRETLENIKLLGVNRLSIGVQSFQESDLEYMGRVHTKEQAISAVTIAQEIGFDNISIDLIFGTPGSNDSKLRENIDYTLKLNVQHVSAYSLTVEPNTILHHNILRKKTIGPSDENVARQFLLVHDRLTLNGFEHYEISNYALEGYQSKHNSNYWKGVPYLGIGPSAHSFNGQSRMWNVANNARYIKNINSGSVAYQEERLRDKDKINEYIMLSLRSYGIELAFYERQFGLPKEGLLDKAKDFLENGTLSLNNDVMSLTKEGMLYSDAISAELFED